MLSCVFNRVTTKVKKKIPKHKNPEKFKKIPKYLQLKNKNIFDKIFEFLDTLKYNVLWTFVNSAVLQNLQYIGNWRAEQNIIKMNTWSGTTDRLNSFKTRAKTKISNHRRKL